MDDINNKLRDYKLPLTAGAVSVVMGYLAKRALKKDIIQVGGVKKTLEAFVLVGLSALIAEEISKYPKIGPMPKP